MSWKSRASLAALVASAFAAGCAPPHHHDDEPDGPEPLGEAVLAATVDEAANGGCATSSVEGLSLQIIAQAACIVPGSYVEVPDLGNVSFNATVLRYLEEPARDALVATLEEHPGTSMQVNSMLRTVAQQYLLYHWYLNGQCGIALAATPGNSNHETGLAIDIQQYNTWKSWLSDHGFKWYGSADTVHFDYVGPGAVNYKGTDVLAFQVLWNKNHPEDMIAEDGDYGPQTEARLKKSPAGGFAVGPDCNAAAPLPDMQLAMAWNDAADDFADGASAGRADLFEDQEYTVEMVLSNQGKASAENVDIAVELTEPWLAASNYLIESDYGHPGTFAENDANTHPDNPEHGAPLGAAFSLRLNAFSKGEAKRVTLVVRAGPYSIAKDTAPEVRFWVKDVPGAYHQDSYGGAADNVDGSQTWGGGVLQLSAPADVYSMTQWQWDTDRREGWEAVGQAEVAASVELSALTLADPAGLTPDGALAQSPEIAVSADDLAAFQITGSAPNGGVAFLYFATETAPGFDTTRRFELDLASLGPGKALTVDASSHPDWTGRITRLGLGAPGGALQAGSLRLLPSVDGGDGGGGDGGGGGGDGGAGGGGGAPAIACSCDVPGSAPAGGELPLLYTIALLGLAAGARGRARGRR